MARPCLVQNGVGYVPLSNGAWALVDPDDVPRVQTRSWAVTGHGYPHACFSSGGKRSWVQLHRFIFGAVPEGLEVDHVNRNPLDCRRANLRVCTRQQNLCNRRKATKNRSGFKGVSWCPARCKWVAYAKVHGKNRNLGGYDTPEEAHAAYCRAVDRLHGAFACKE